MHRGGGVCWTLLAVWPLVELELPEKKNERVARDESKPMMPNFMVLFMSLVDLPGQVNDPKIGKIRICWKFVK